MPLKWFKVMIDEKKNFLVRPSSWDDPHEMNYSKSELTDGNTSVSLDASHWFGQCWSLCEESAIIWHTFKKTEEPYVKIKVYASDLIRDFKEHDDKLRIAILDNIRYFKPTLTDYEEKIKDLMELHPWPGNFIPKGSELHELFPLYNLLTKRDLFSHEEEVRLLLFDKSVPANQKNTYYKFDLANIKEVIIDPWTSVKDVEFKDIRNDLRKTLKEENVKIEKSKLFEDSVKFAIHYKIK